MTEPSSVTFREWRDKHQRFELDYHRGDNYRWRDEDFVAEWEYNFGGFLELNPDHFAEDDLLLDVGCGSRPALSYFTSGKHKHIDPLADRYLEIDEIQKYWSTEDRCNLITSAAEAQIDRLVSKCAFVNCWNVLDHCYNWRVVLGNVCAYARPGAIIALCTDTKAHGDGHPGIDCPGDIFEIACHWCRIERLEINYGDTVKRDLAMKLRRRI